MSNRPGQGRPRKPNELLEALDSRNAKTAVIESSDLRSPDVAPIFLSSSAKTHWQMIVPRLASEGVAKEADRTLLAMLCDALARYYDNSVDDESEPIVSEKERARISKQILEISDKFGMNPMSRSRSGISKKTPGIKVRGK